MAGKPDPNTAARHAAIYDAVLKLLTDGTPAKAAYRAVAGEIGMTAGGVQNVFLAQKSLRGTGEGDATPLQINVPEVAPEAPAAADGSTLALRKANTHLKQHNADLRAENERLVSELEESKIYKEFFAKLDTFQPQPPDWLKKAKYKNDRLSIPTAMLSDLHLDEVVRPEQVNFVNAYDRAIAEARLKLFFQNTIELAFDHVGGLKYGGIVLPLAGDIFSGDIHEELKETNADTLFGSVLYWIDPFIAGIKMLADAFGKVYIPCVVGNHGRMTRKPRAKFRAQDNVEYLFNKLLQKFLAGDKRITFQVSDAADLPYQILNTRYLETHGDQFRGGSGISGLLAPLMLGGHRKRKREQAVAKPFDVMILGHWHTLTFLGDMIVNGSLKGYDEYAYISNFGYEPPQQAFWITDERYGVTIKAPIHCAEADSYGEQEQGGWLKAA